MTEICDPQAGWNNQWAHCRGLEDACIEVELSDVMTEQVYVIINRTWAEEEEGKFIYKGEYIEYTEGSTVWRVYCDDINTSQNLASIRICYEEGGTGDDDEKDVKEGDEFNWKGHAIKILNIVCGPVNYVDAAIDGVTKHLTFDEDATAKDWFLATIFPGPILGGALFIAVKSISAGCTGAKLVITGGGLSEAERDTIDEEIVEEGVTTPDGTVIDVTPETVEAADMQAYKDMLRSSEHDEALQNKADGDWTLEQLKTFEKEWKKERTKEIIIRDYYATNFNIAVPSWTMAGDVEISGTAPKANAAFQIMAVKKYFGFDAFATDAKLADVTSGDDYKFTATIPLEEFGALTIYAKAPKGWFEIWEADVETDRHTIYVITWMIVVAVIVAAALIYDKQQKGKFIGIFKKKR